MSIKSKEIRPDADRRSRYEAADRRSDIRRLRPRLVRSADNSETAISILLRAKTKRRALR